MDNSSVGFCFLYIALCIPLKYFYLSLFSSPPTSAQYPQFPLRVSFLPTGPQKAAGKNITLIVTCTNNQSNICANK